MHNKSKRKTCLCIGNSFLLLPADSLKRLKLEYNLIEVTTFSDDDDIYILGDRKAGKTMDKLAIPALDLGRVVRDTITGFEGTVTAYIRYLNGCTQFQLQPSILQENGQPVEAVWFDINQLAIADEEEKLGKEAYEEEPPSIRELVNEDLSIREESPGGPPTTSIPVFTLYQYLISPSSNYKHLYA